MRLRVFVLVLLLVAFGGTALAQGGALNYGASVLGELTATNPLGFYTFTGTEGDRVSVQVIGVGIDPAVSLNAPSQQQLANNDNDAANPGSTDAYISVVLPQSGTYTILVSSVTGAPGQFLIRLSGQPPLVGQALTNTPALVDIAAGPQAQVFSFNADPAVPTTLNISTATPGFSFESVVRNSSGQIVALVTDSSAFTYTVAPGDGTYTVEVTPSDPASIGQISILLGAAAVVPAPAATEEASAPPAPVDSADVCMVAAQGSSSVNVRSQPSTESAAIAQINPGTRVPVTGVSGTWYQVSIPNVGFGWVRRDVVTSFGPCDIVPQVEAGQVPPPVVTEEAAPPQQQVTPTFTPTLAQNGEAPVQATPTYTSTPVQEQITGPTATSTYTPTAAPQQPTSTYTPSYTPTAPSAAPTAPPDGNYALVIQLDSTASVTDFVSYPGGDREDRVSWRVQGMNSSVALPGGRARLILSVSCFGTGTQNVTFFTGGQTYTCGQTIRDEEVTFDSNTSSVLITAVSGENTYVQWVLTGTATRIN